MKKNFYLAIGVFFISITYSCSFYDPEGCIITNQNDTIRGKISIYSSKTVYVYPFNNYSPKNTIKVKRNNIKSVIIPIRGSNDTILWNPNYAILGEDEKISIVLELFSFSIGEYGSDGYSLLADQDYSSITMYSNHKKINIYSFANGGFNLQFDKGDYTMLIRFINKRYHKNLTVDDFRIASSNNKRPIYNLKGIVQCILDAENKRLQRRSTKSS